MLHRLNLGGELSPPKFRGCGLTGFPLRENFAPKRCLGRLWSEVSNFRKCPTSTLRKGIHRIYLNWLVGKRPCSALIRGKSPLLRRKARISLISAERVFRGFLPPWNLISRCSACPTFRAKSLKFRQFQWFSPKFSSINSVFKLGAL